MRKQCAGAQDRGSARRHRYSLCDQASFGQGGHLVALKMGLSSTTKVELAVSQLRHAIELFIEARELISAITLAGAAEEILGQLAEKDGFKHALDRRAEGARVMFKHVCGSDPGTQPFCEHKKQDAE